MRLYDEKDIYNSLRPRVTNAELDDIMLPLKPVKAIPLEKVKQAREKIAKVYPESIFDHDKALRTTLQIIDELIAESEEK